MHYYFAILLYYYSMQDIIIVKDVNLARSRFITIFRDFSEIPRLLPFPAPFAATFQISAATFSFFCHDFLTSLVMLPNFFRFSYHHGHQQITRVLTTLQLGSLVHISFHSSLEIYQRVGIARQSIKVLDKGCGLYQRPHPLCLCILLYENCGLWPICSLYMYVHTCGLQVAYSVEYEQLCLHVCLVILIA